MNGSILDLEVIPYGMRLHLFVDRARFRRAANAARKNSRMTAVEVGDAVGMCSVRGPVIYLGVFDGTVGTMVHELVHALDHVIDHCNLCKLGDGNGDEPAAFLMEHLFTECLAALTEHRRRNP